MICYILYTCTSYIINNYYDFLQPAYPFDVSNQHGVRDTKSNSLMSVSDSLACCPSIFSLNWHSFSKYPYRECLQYQAWIPTDSLWQLVQILFLNEKGDVFPLFCSIKQFHHELINYPKLFNQLGLSKRFFIRLSQKIDKLPSKFKLLKKIGSVLLKVLRKYKLNFISIKANNYGEIYNNSYELNKVFFINKCFDSFSEEIDFTNILRSITSNIVYADIEMIKRYNTALFSGKIDSVECIEKMKKQNVSPCVKMFSKTKTYINSRSFIH